MSSVPQAFPLSSDHLIRLIEYNVFRACLTNIYILSLSHALHNPACSGYHLRPDPPLFPRSAAATAPAHAGGGGVPESLRPTELQRTTPHGVWIDILPSPRMRDNAIVAVREGRLREWDLCGDVLKGMCGTAKGEQAQEQGQEEGRRLESSERVGRRRVSGRDRVEGAAEKEDVKGQDEEEEEEEEDARILVWSNPWEPAGWELTKGFWKKYGFLLKGCEDLLHSTNRWREVRGDGPVIWQAFIS